MSIKSLAGQTMWYGVGTVLGRFLGYFLTIILYNIYKPADLAPVIMVYAMVPFLNVLFTLGLETSYFRYSKTTDTKKLFNDLSSLIIVSTAALLFLLVAFKGPIMRFTEMDARPTYYFLMIAIVAIDTLCALPFVALRQAGQPKKFAVLKLLNVIINMSLVLLFLVVLKPLSVKTILPTWLYNTNIDIGYFIIANLVASIITFFMLLPQWRTFKFNWNALFLKQVMRYSAPIIIVGFAGMVNEFLSRILYYKILSDVPKKILDHEFGVFSASYKLAVLATIFIQIFKMGAEPFFFAQSDKSDARPMYARVTKIFVIICTFLFLLICCNLDGLKLIVAMRNKEYAEGLKVVPILTMANILLGVYYNLTVWYKNTDQTMKGALITFIGTAITIPANLLLVPEHHYVGAAWATLICYASMLVISYVWGQREYPIPYDVKRIALYFASCVGLFLLFQFASTALGFSGLVWGLSGFVMCSVIMAAIVYVVDKDELKRLPFIKKFVH
jgi:O-antigen/teichoic acid export membrane protein